uniref:Uncharacterized protein n=1 Tax=Spongospora subterranea TaxID=70186 RepID=A0A0H5QZY6_9EUKA|eukprot:CRZ07253.1 hypothetical protein [Spongospora subterranea]
MNWFNVMIFPLCNSEAMEGLASRDSFDVFDFSWSLWRNTHIAIVYGSQTNYFDCTSAPLLNFGISGHQISERIRMAISNLFSWFSCSNIDPQFCRDGSSMCDESLTDMICLGGNVPVLVTEVLLFPDELDDCIGQVEQLIESNSLMRFRKKFSNPENHFVVVIFSRKNKNTPD